MSHQYWVKITTEGEAYGPYSAADLRGYVTEGRVTPQSLISTDQVKWHQAARVGGLFGAKPPPPPAAPPPANPAMTAPMPIAAPAPIPVPLPIDASDAGPFVDRAPSQQPISLAYRTAGSANDTVPTGPLPYIRSRSSIPFLVVAILMFISGGVIAFQAYGGQNSNSRSMDGLLYTLISLAVFFLLSVPALVLWLMWVAAAHRDMAVLSQGAYRITPGSAVGFSFIPFFDAYWVIYMPWNLAKELNRHLAARQLAPVSAGAVLGCQIVSVASALFFPGLTPILYAVSLTQMQGGFNRLSAAARVG